MAESNDTLVDSKASTASEPGNSRRTDTWQSLLIPYQTEVVYYRRPGSRGVSEPIYDYMLNGELHRAPHTLSLESLDRYTPPVIRNQKRQICRGPSQYLLSTCRLPPVLGEKTSLPRPPKTPRLTTATLQLKKVNKKTAKEYEKAAQEGFPARYRPTAVLLDTYDLNAPRPWRKSGDIKPTATQAAILEHLARSAAAGDSSKYGTTILVEGPGGSGKSQLIEFFQEAGRHVLYCTVKNSLCRHMANTFDCRSMTFASLFLRLFGLRVSEGLYNFEPTVNGLELDTVQALFDAARKVQLTSTWYFPPDIDVLVIDEYSTLAVSMLKLVLLRLHHGREATKRRLDIVLLGDPYQLPPIQYRYEANNFLVRNLVDYVFQLTVTCRFKNPRYAALMEKVRVAPSTRAIYGHLASYMPAEVWADRTVVELTYPFDDPMPACHFTENGAGDVSPFSGEVFADFALVNKAEITEWLARWHTVINDTLFLARRNLSVHRLCMTYAHLIHSHSADSVEFVPIRFVAHNQRGERFTIFSFFKQDCAPLLPLIRGADYIFLYNDKVCKRGEILTYLGRNDERLVLRDARGLLVSVRPQLFQMQLFCSNKYVYLNALDPDTRKKYGSTMTARELYGYPLQLAVAQNIYQCQGRTYTNKKLYINVNKTTKEETYVALSRVVDERSIKNIFLLWYFLFFFFSNFYFSFVPVSSDDASARRVK